MFFRKISHFLMALRGLINVKVTFASSLPAQFNATYVTLTHHKSPRVDPCMP